MWALGDNPGLAPSREERDDSNDGDNDSDTEPYSATFRRLRARTTRSPLTVDRSTVVRQVDGPAEYCHQRLITSIAFLANDPPSNTGSLLKSRCLRLSPNPAVYVCHRLKHTLTDRICDVLRTHIHPIVVVEIRNSRFGLGISVALTPRYSSTLRCICIPRFDLI